MTVALSIVIPTHNRCLPLLKNLVRLEAQIENFSETELIIAADSCQDGTEREVELWAAGTRLNLRVLKLNEQNASATRNRGALAATGETLLFLDDDIETLPGFLAAHMRAREDSVAVLGYSKPVFARPLTLWQKEARLWWIERFHSMSRPGHRFTYRDFFSGNVSMPRALFHTVGGFNEKLTRLEDYEFGLGLFKAGGRLRYVPEACGLHRDSTDLAQWLRRIKMEGEADVLIGDTHPETRANLWLILESGRPRPSWLRQFALRFSCRGDLLVKCLTVAAERAGAAGLRSLSRKFVRTARDYQYLRGVLSIRRYREFAAWLQDGLPPPQVECDAPSLDLTAIPSDVETILAVGTTKGLRICQGDVELGSIPPIIGAEPLRPQHLEPWEGSQLPAGPAPPTRHDRSLTGEVPANA